jgi:energy-coupling factor transport system permease protein
MITDTYKPGDSLTHRIDPRTKLILLIAYCVFFFLPVPLYLQASYLATLILLSVLSLGSRELLKPLSAILPFLILILLLTPPFHRGGRPILVVFKWTILTVAGLEEAGRVMIRFMGITLGFFLFLRTTEMNLLVTALRWYGLPYRGALILTTAFRYIPYVAKVYRNVNDAHSLRRGTEEHDARRRGFWKKLRQSLPGLTSVFIFAIKGVPTLAMALECRGVGRSNRRSSYVELKSGALLAKDILLTIIGLLILALPAVLSLL